MRRLLLWLLALPALVLPVLVLGDLLVRGMPALDWAFVSSAGEGAGFGVSTGVLPQIIGSLLLALSACLLAAPLAVGAALYHHLYAPPRMRRLLQIMLGMLQGIPPLVIGLCGLLVLVHGLGWGVSLASGAVVLALVVLPLMVLNTVDALQRVAAGQGESARALGLGDLALVGRVWLPQVWPGILSGLFLAVARALSETAPVLLTAAVFSGVTWPEGPASPVTALQTRVFYLAQEGADPRAIAVAWSSALVLVGLTAGFALLGRLLQPRSGGKDHGH